MSTKTGLALITSLLAFTAGCDQSERSGKIMEPKQTYSLCPKSPDSVPNLRRQIRKFALEQQAQITERSVDVQQELADIESSVLKKTGGEAVLLTIEKPGTFRISVTNLGLEKKFVLAIRSTRKNGRNIIVDRFMHDVSRFWTIQEVDGAVTNTPPC